MATTVILGAGIIGVSTAYYLSDHQPGNTIHLVDASPELFTSASGFAGGFLAKDWVAPTLLSLSALSFNEHRRLAEANDGRQKWGYSPTTALSYTTARPRKGAAGRRGEDWLREGASRAEAASKRSDVIGGPSGNGPAWLRRQEGDNIVTIGDERTTAQVDPRRLCQFLLQECLDRGVRLHRHASALSVGTDMRGELASIRIADVESSTETDVPCTKVVITAGAWSPQVFKTLFRESSLELPITNLAGHSLVVRSPRWSSEMEEAGCHAVFGSSEPGYSPELFSRIGNEIYLAGLNTSSLPLLEMSTDSRVIACDIERLKGTARQYLGTEEGVDDLEVVRESLCFRPVTPTGRPFLTRLPDKCLGGGLATRGGADGGVFFSAGHGPWGISLSLGTGIVLAEMIQGRKPSASVAGLEMG